MQLDRLTAIPSYPDCMLAVIPALLLPMRLISYANLQTSDVDSLDHVVSALYEVISGPAGQARNWERMRSLFAPNASMGAAVVSKKQSVSDIEFNVEKYISMSGPYLEKSGLFERETKRRTEKYEHIAHIFSSYESRKSIHERPFETGVNSIQLFHDGKRWWIRSIFWEGKETEKPKSGLKPNP